MNLRKILFNPVVFRPLIALTAVSPLVAAQFSFSTGDPDGLMATASRPSSLSPGKIEIESADDFVLTQGVSLTGATFTGLLPTGVDATAIKNVNVEIYRVFPKDSDAGRTINVPTRANSPSDVVFDSRDAAGGGLTFTTGTLNPSFTAANSILNGINPKPSQTTGGEGPITGQEVRFSVNFTTSLDLPADHYFFIPQVELTSGDFYWLSAPKPIVPPGTAFNPDLQTWIRDEDLDPDWLRIGTDIVGGPPTFNASFSLTGVLQDVPDGGTTAALAGFAVLLLGAARRSVRD